MVVWTSEVIFESDLACAGHDDEFAFWAARCFIFLFYANLGFAFSIALSVSSYLFLFNLLPH